MVVGLEGKLPLPVLRYPQSNMENARSRALCLSGSAASAAQSSQTLDPRTKPTTLHADKPCVGVRGCASRQLTRAVCAGGRAQQELRTVPEDEDRGLRDRARQQALPEAARRGPGDARNPRAGPPKPQPCPAAQSPGCRETCGGQRPAGGAPQGTPQGALQGALAAQPRGKCRRRWRRPRGKP